MTPRKRISKAMAREWAGLVLSPWIRCLLSVSQVLFELNLYQQWSARQRLREFAKSIPKVSAEHLPKSGDW
jgi:hypothetical protein